MVARGHVDDFFQSASTQRPASSTDTPTIPHILGFLLVSFPLKSRLLGKKHICFLPWLHPVKGQSEGWMQSINQIKHVIMHSSFNVHAASMQ